MRKAWLFSLTLLYTVTVNYVGISFLVRSQDYISAGLGLLPPEASLRAISPLVWLRSTNL